MDIITHIDFLQMAPDTALKERALAHIERLAERFGRMLSCRCTITAPSAHHRTGSAYEVRIRITLPEGPELAIDRVAGDDERLADPHFAIDLAFKRARRQLEDRLQRREDALSRPPSDT